MADADKTQNSNADAAKPAGKLTAADAAKREAHRPGCR